MGLDMYLTKRSFIGNKHRKPGQRVGVTIPKNQKDAFVPTREIKKERISSIEEEVAYWRKANAIHSWFVQNVQKDNDDCGDYLVDEDKMQELLDIINKVLASTKLVDGEIKNGTSFKNGIGTPNVERGQNLEDSTVAAQLLPTKRGFFFGGSDYDEYYWKDLIYTKEVLEKALAEGGDFYYHSSW